MTETKPSVEIQSPLTGVVSCSQQFRALVLCMDGKKRAVVWDATPAKPRELLDPGSLRSMAFIGCRMVHRVEPKRALSFELSEDGGNTWVCLPT